MFGYPRSNLIDTGEVKPTSVVVAAVRIPDVAVTVLVVARGQTEIVSSTLVGNRIAEIPRRGTIVLEPRGVHIVGDICCSTLPRILDAAEDLRLIKLIGCRT